MRASQPVASHPSARSRQQQPPPPVSQPDPHSTAASTSPQPSTFTTSITLLNDLFTYSYPTPTLTTTHNPSNQQPFVLSLRTHPDCLLLTATNLSTLYQLRLTASHFDDKCRRLNFGSTTDRYSGLCDLLRTSVHNNTALQPKLTHTVTGVRGSDCSTAVLDLCFTLRVGTGAGLDVECSWQLPSLLRHVRQPTQPTADESRSATAADSDDATKRRKRRPAADDLDSLDFPDLPDELLMAAAVPHSQSSVSAAAVQSQLAGEDEWVYQREVAHIVHRLLDLHLVSTQGITAAATTVGGASLELTQLKEQVRLLEQQLTTQTERCERMEKELLSVRGGVSGGSGGGGGGVNGGGGDKRKPRQMSDRSVINPAVRKRKARGIHLEG